MNQRKNVYQLPAGDTTLEWYGKAVIAMKKRPTKDPTSWNYQAAIHGFNSTLPYWQGIGKTPGRTEKSEFWNQCQHGSWFFLPWHRMYLAYFEQIVAQTIVSLGGPAGWALPFWNYSDSTNPHALTIPPAFTKPGNAANGLWMDGRESNTIDPRYVTLGALDTIPYTGDGRTSPLGFGGPETTFSHSGRTHGELESLPHDMVHVAIGGAMGDPRTAALDPIFWLHHANIDRLWQVWLNKGNNRENPTESAWLDLEFDFHDKTGAKAQMKAADVLDTTKVLSGYTYQGVTPAAPALAPVNLLQRIDFSTPLEIVAATNKQTSLSSAKTTVQLKLSPAPRKKENFAAVTAALKTPPKTFLHFENITGKGIPPIHDVYLNAPDGGKGRESYYAGSLSFFGVDEASTPSLHQSGSGQHYCLDITNLMNKLRSLPNWNEQQLDVSIDPIRPMAKGTSVKIGRISLYTE